MTCNDGQARHFSSSSRSFCICFGLFHSLACMQGVEEVLRAIPYGTNEVYLHTDARLMARNRQAWASWNFIGAKGNPETTPVCVTYWVNRLQRVPADAPETFVTLNPACPPAQEKTALHAQLAHPVFSFASLHAQEQLPRVQVGSIDANALQGLSDAIYRWHSEARLISAETSTSL